MSFRPTTNGIRVFIVIAAMNHELRELNLEYPKVSVEQRAALNTVRAKLEAEG
jgi:hypothetical protein